MLLKDKVRVLERQDEKERLRMVVRKGRGGRLGGEVKMEEGFRLGRGKKGESGEEEEEEEGNDEPTVRMNELIFDYRLLESFCLKVFWEKGNVVILTFFIFTFFCIWDFMIV